MKKYELIVFDWDGTLMDSAQEIITCFARASADLGITAPTPDEVKNVIGLGMQEALHILFPQITTDAEREAVVERYRHHYFSADKVPSELFEGVFDLIQRLSRQGYMLAVATGKGRRGLDMVLERTGLGELFHYSRCVDEAHSKPHPQMLEDTMDFMGVTPEQTLMVGDSIYDLQMANNAKTASVGVCCGAHPRERLLECKPVACLETTAELFDWLHPA
jgi:phosphoglycolate phosphatase